MPSIDICLASSLSSAATRRRPSAPRRRAASTCATSAEVVVSLAILGIYAAPEPNATSPGRGAANRLRIVLGVVNTQRTAANYDAKLFDAIRFALTAQRPELFGARRHGAR